MARPTHLSIEVSLENSIEDQHDVLYNLPVNPSIFHSCISFGWLYFTGPLPSMKNLFDGTPTNLCISEPLIGQLVLAGSSTDRYTIHKERRVEWLLLHTHTRAL